tara:strand:+ start:6049 stop:6366 length:318 start_codon:yes stop_codon:yes gene_type:complete
MAKSIDKYATLDALKGAIRYNIANTIIEQQNFVERISKDSTNQTGSQKKETEAYYNQQRNKLTLMLQFLGDAIADATGEYFELKRTGSMLHHYDVELVIKKKETA